MPVKVFVPGHITGFFSVHRHSDPYRTGSRGAGVCLSLGVVTLAGEGTGVRSQLRDHVRRVFDIMGVEVSVEQEFQLPVSQGFGMSGACALGAALAAARIHGIPESEAVRAAHRAEVEAGTGLGDVYPQYVGGITCRLREGAPPHGDVRSWQHQGRLVVAVLGKPISTHTVISDSEIVRSVNAHGEAAREEFLREPCLENLVRLSRRFSVDTGLAPREVLEVYSRTSGIAMSMLGTSVFGPYSAETGSILQHAEVLRVCSPGRVRIEMR